MGCIMIGRPPSIVPTVDIDVGMIAVRPYLRHLFLVTLSSKNKEHATNSSAQKNK